MAGAVNDIHDIRRPPDDLFVCTHFRCAIVLYFFGTAFKAIVGCMLYSEGVAPGYSDAAFQANGFPSSE